MPRPSPESSITSRRLDSEVVGRGTKPAAGPWMSSAGADPDVVDPLGRGRAKVERTLPRLREARTVFAGLHWRRPAAFVIGISAAATVDAAGPTIAMTLGSATNALALCAPRFGDVRSPARSSRLSSEDLRTSDTARCVRLVDRESNGVPGADAAIDGAREWHVEADRPGPVGKTRGNRAKPQSRRRPRSLPGRHSNREYNDTVGRRLRLDAGVGRTGWTTPSTGSTE